MKELNKLLTKNSLSNYILIGLSCGLSLAALVANISKFFFDKYFHRTIFHIQFSIFNNRLCFIYSKRLCRCCSFKATRNGLIISPLKHFKDVLFCKIQRHLATGEPIK